MGLVIQRGQFALRIRQLKREVQMVDGERMIGRLTPSPGDFDERQMEIKYIEEEKAIYRRLGECPGITRCCELDSPDVSIRMKLMKDGDLRHYLVTTRPDRRTHSSWLMDLAHALRPHP